MPDGPKAPGPGPSAGFVATIKINRADWGIVWNETLGSGGVLVGDQVDITVDVELLEQANTT